ncbi:MAG: TatD family hydrolase [Candidatus Sabulitectum sp.]|nr:TatD family hydrolase [Candidatus Sabulitectum sp.]
MIMQGLFDTHCHLFMEPLSRDTGGVLERAFAVGVERLLVPAVSMDNWDACSELALLPGIGCALGIHPWWADDGVVLEELRTKLIETNASAIGEIGLDWKTEVPRQKQYTVFQKQLELASSMDLPVILHCRNAFDEMLELLKKHPVRGVIHAWSRDPHLMDRFIEAGLYISFGGVITRPGAKKACESARLVPSDRFVLETDSPSIGLSGVPSGKSEPGHVAEIAQAMAQIRGADLKDTQAAAWKNSIALFGDSS